MSREGEKEMRTDAMEEITSADCSDFAFIIYEITDSADHDFGFAFNNPVYKDIFRTEDAYGYEVIKAFVKALLSIDKSSLLCRKIKNYLLLFSD